MSSRLPRGDDKQATVTVRVPQSLKEQYKDSVDSMSDDLREYMADQVGADDVEDDDPGWDHLTPHDLRRTWATALASADVDPLLVCDWGGWTDLETFLDHSRGTFSPEAQKRERGKVGWL